MKDNNLCVVIFPIYRSLKDSERECLEQAVAMTKGFDHIFIAPESLNIDNTFGSLSSLDIIRFDNEFFQSVQGYNKLMLSLSFYERFTYYKYILIHQTDAYLFKPELEYWCNKNYDYIGAPWLRLDLTYQEKIEMVKIKHFPFIYSPSEREKRKCYTVHNEVGNGGLSLRKIESFVQILKKAPKSLIEKYISGSSHVYNEDVFWGIEAQHYQRSFRKPSFRKALKFSFEQSPAKAYRIIGKQLPFGCHAFEVHNANFWKQFIPPLNKKS